MTATNQTSNQNIKSRAELIAARVKCDEDLLFFTRFFYKELRGTKFIVNDHHREISNSLDEVANYTLEYLGINIPPRMSKTELVLNFIARGIGQNATANYLYITASDELRAEVSVRIRDIVSHRYFKMMYGTELKKDQNGKNLWRTTEGGGLKTATIFGQITGFGAGQMIDHTSDNDDELLEYIRDFEGCIAMDDINKMDDAETANAKNEKVIRVISNTVLSRKNSSDTPIINIQQRAGMDDATAFFMRFYEDNPKAKFMVMPVITDGVPLWSWKYGVEEINKMRNNSETSHVFETQYMQNPKPKEGLLYDLNYYDELTNEDGAINLGAVDVADQGTDYLSAPFAKIIGKRIYIHDAVYDQSGSEKTSGKVSSKTLIYNVSRLIVERNNQGATYITLLIKMGVPRGLILDIISKGNKMARMEANAWIINKYFYFKRTGSVEYMMFLNRLENILRTDTKEDDAADSVTILAKYLIANKAYHYIFRD